MIKDIWKKIISPVLLLLSSGGIAQIIPYGTSIDTIQMPFPCIWDDTCALTYQTYYYKPSTYDSLTSPILLFIHGTGGTGNEGPQYLSEMAERRKALIVAPTTSAIGNAFWAIGIDNIYESDTTNPSCPTCKQIIWLPEIIKKIYQHVLQRELRDSIPVYFTGFSSGGQSVSRYMLIRQAIPDSVPIVMAVSSNPFYYTFCYDYLDGVLMPFACGIAPGSIWSKDDFCVSGSYTQKRDITLDFICDKHVMMYYDENYGVLIGTADTTGAYSALNCIQAQGANRYERAQKFFNFSYQDAVNRGTLFNWKYVEIEGAGHGTIPMYQTKANPNDSSTIAETLLFDTPYHSPTYSPPNADFSYYFLDTVTAVIQCVSTPYQIGDTSCHTVFFEPHCFQSKFPSTIFWDFGDGTTSTETYPNHQYPDQGVYNVMLIVSDSFSNDTMVQTIIIDSLTEISAAGPTVFCQGDSVMLTVNPAISYQWSTGDTANYLYADETDFYSVTTSNGCKYTSDSVMVWAKPVPPLPTISQNGDTLLSPPANNYQWYLNGSALLNDTNQKITVMQSGYYQVEVFHVNGCSTISDSVYIIKTGEEKLLNKVFGFPVFPNPGDGKFVLRFQDIGADKFHHCQLKVCNLLGEIVFSDSFSLVESELGIDLSHIPSGIYFLSVTGQEGNFFSEKIVIH